MKYVIHGGKRWHFRRFIGSGESQQISLIRDGRLLTIPSRGVRVHDTDDVQGMAGEEHVLLLDALQREPDPSRDSLAFCEGVVIEFLSLVNVVRSGQCLNDLQFGFCLGEAEPENFSLVARQVYSILLGHKDGLNDTGSWIKSLESPWTDSATERAKGEGGIKPAFMRGDSATDRDSDPIYGNRTLLI